MRAPKILPWIAKRAGIDERLALKLWRRAAGEAELIVGNHHSSEFHRLTMERFISLVELEAGCKSLNPQNNMNVTWMWRHQSHMARLTLMAAESTYHLWRKNWAEFYGTQKIAA